MNVAEREGQTKHHQTSRSVSEAGHSRNMRDQRDTGREGVRERDREREKEKEKDKEKENENEKEKEREGRREGGRDDVT